MIKLKKMVSVLAISVMLEGSAFASGIPVVDAAAISQMVNQILEMQKQYQMLTDQYEKMKEQYDQLKTITSKLDGVTDLYNFLRDEDNLQMFPEFYEGLSDLTFDTLEAGAKVIYQQRGYDKQCEGLGEPLKSHCESENSLLATKEYEFIENAKKVKDRIGNLNAMLDEIKNCQTAKEIQDLQARIQGELGMIQIANVQVELSKNTLDAVIDGVKRMKEAQEHEYFTVSDDYDLSSAFE